MITYLQVDLLLYASCLYLQLYLWLQQQPLILLESQNLVFVCSRSLYLYHCLIRSHSISDPLPPLPVAWTFSSGEGEMGEGSKIHVSKISKMKN